MRQKSYDLAIVGAGIVGLAHALAASRRGKSVIVIDRDSYANGASIRNFGFVTVTGQQAGDCWQKALRSRQVWAEVADAARIPLLHEGLTMTAHLPESEAVIDAFLKTEMGADCQRLTPSEAALKVPRLRQDKITCALYSPFEIRVESRDALPRIANWLEEVHAVDFLWQTSVNSVETPKLETSRGTVHAQTVIVCPGDDGTTLFSDRIAAYEVTRCKLQMLRVAPRQRLDLGTAVMSDLGLARYLGYAELPEAAPLKARLDREMTDQRDNGIHLIVVQSEDGSLVVGDSHHYSATPDPFIDKTVNDLILGEMETILDLGPYDISETWIGTYASAPDRWRFTDAPDDATRIVVVTAGCGASTAFAIGEETIADLYA
ncbi:FAD dependent oxidoreductase [Stappia aggregata IAM 12614]|uniref:FAD dependent oxidoreductase n=1 Tax=Roseibium aggregatum (strain ATCC 25650 / DSM 13394 / JCM 20685 / NBRC 16684 / NCIMB 2208 / IAM 12614 / B1) TaxID=384765 RepID=A0NWN8_ROSAI|nr:TIGR03364 family FAD-dependent oxidoreductase [Roseibium aggregatum]EAV42959.1 FAD dependent oxidoreductase [Stappia aggregata IAM 12614] [Roseibium aggregatum IAM 12614]